MNLFYQGLLLFGVVIFFYNIKNKIVNRRERGKVLYKLLLDNRNMNIVSVVVIMMLMMMGYALYGRHLAGEIITEIEITQFIATLVLFLAVSINSLSKTIITEAGIIKNNMLIRWEAIKKIEWTSFNSKTCKLVIDYNSPKRASIIKITVKEDRTEKDMVTSLIKQYRKSSKKKK
ncbi:MAG: hypothetical protein Q8S24_06325 [Eubacteriales bacterium]|nr:hypothetical protein [Eubacteriales bacterium]